MIIAIIIIVIILAYAFIMYNTFINLNNRVKEAFSTMDVYLKKRWDLIPNLVETVKGYASHEKDTITEVISMRSGEYDNYTDEEKIKTNEKLSNDISKIMILAENYPDLKASNNFKELSSQLVAVEDEIANSRKYYNGVVRIYNNKVEMFPSNLFAKIYGYKPKSMFEADKSEKENVKVEL